jgi:hypothetical protein
MTGIGSQVFGPHVSILYTRTASLHALTSIVDHFRKVDTLPRKLQPGGPGYELVYSTTAILPYLLSLSPSNSLNASFEAIASYERKLLGVLLGFLTAPEQVKRGVRVLGDDKVGTSRVPIVSFVVTGQRAIRSKEVVKVYDAKGEVNAISR